MTLDLDLPDPYVICLNPDYRGKYWIRNCSKTIQIIFPQKSQYFLAEIRSWYQLP